jgi:hypothetical protein
MMHDGRPDDRPPCNAIPFDRNSKRPCREDNIQVVRRAVIYLVTSIPGHLLWEMAQLPLYTIRQSGTTGDVLFAVIHCSAGDALIAATSLAVAALLARAAGWRTFGGRMITATIVLGMSYTVFSEWLNVEIRHSWSYTAAMPVIPGLGTGLTPLVQWLIVPWLAFALTGRKGLRA